MSIPILNLYYLLCYAWDKLEEREVVEVSGADSADLADLFARVLVNGVRHVLRRGLDRGYTVHHERTSRIRGRIDFSTSIQHAAIGSSRLYCSFDELSYDVLHNRILKTTLRELASSEGLNPELAYGLLWLYRRLDGVHETRITPQSFGRVQLSRSSRFYEFLLNICSLVHENLLVDEKTGKRQFRDFDRDESKMAPLFQSFVRNFYARHQSHNYRVKASRMGWYGADGSEAALEYLPTMNTDITLESSSRVLIIDTKYYKNPFDRPHGGAEKLKAGNLYQIFSYVENYSRTNTRADVEGILLYPGVSPTPEMNYKLLGRAIRVAFINLNQHWTGIEKDLNSLVS